jgi:uncharacterized protein with HEPN domain
MIRSAMAKNSMMAARIDRPGESPAEFRVRYAGVPGQSATDLRNAMIHDYDTVDFDERWRTHQEHLPPLVDQWQAITDEKLPAI